AHRSRAAHPDLFRPRRLAACLRRTPVPSRRGSRPLAVPRVDYGYTVRSPEVFAVTTVLSLNERAQRLAAHLATHAAGLRIAVEQTANGARVFDCGVKVEGGLHAGLGLARVCLAGQAEVLLAPGEVDGVPCVQVQVATDHPVTAC